MSLLKQPKKPVMEHVGRILRPRGTGQNEIYGERGEVLDPPLEIYCNIPLAITELNGREVEQAREQYASATQRVYLHEDPCRPVQASDMLEVDGMRKVHIGAVIRHGMGDTELLCGESVA